MLQWIKQFLWINPALVLTHSAIKHCCPSAWVHPANGCRHQQITLMQNRGSAGQCQVMGTHQQDWSPWALVCCLAGISIVYWQQSTLHNSPSYHGLIIQHHASICDCSSKENTNISLPLAKISQTVYQYVDWCCVYLGAGRGWMAQSLQESWGRCHCWRETEGRASLERWGRSSLRCVAGKTLERWRLEACEARCDSGCGTALEDCAEGWTRCVVAPKLEEALRKDDNVLNILTDHSDILL